MLSGIVELNTIMKSVGTSALCLLYVICIMFVFFFHFGVAGVYLFGRNDPFHFENIGKALLTLFQVCLVCLRQIPMVCLYVRRVGFHSR
jgi:voltage-gated sodium channel